MSTRRCGARFRARPRSSAAHPAFEHPCDVELASGELRAGAVVEQPSFVIVHAFFDNEVLRHPRLGRTEPQQVEGDEIGSGGPGNRAVPRALVSIGEQGVGGPKALAHPKRVLVEQQDGVAPAIVEGRGPLGPRVPSGFILQPSAVCTHDASKLPGCGGIRRIASTPSDDQPRHGATIGGVPAATRGRHLHRKARRYQRVQGSLCSIDRCARRRGHVSRRQRPLGSAKDLPTLHGGNVAQGAHHRWIAEFHACFRHGDRTTLPTRHAVGGHRNPPPPDQGDRLHESRWSPTVGESGDCDQANPDA